MDGLSWFWGSGLVLCWLLVTVWAATCVMRSGKSRECDPLSRRPSPKSGCSDYLASSCAAHVCCDSLGRLNADKEVPDRSWLGALVTPGPRAAFEGVELCRLSSERRYHGNQPTGPFALFESKISRRPHGGVAASAQPLRRSSHDRRLHPSWTPLPTYLRQLRPCAHPGRLAHGLQ